MILQLLYTFSVILGSLFFEETDASEKNLIDLGFEYIDRSIEVAPIELFTEPQNNFNSIKYALYTPSNPKEACFFEPTPEDFDNCPFDSNRKTEFLIHGFVSILQPGNLFEELKDTLLDYDGYNIIIVNWTLYNELPLLKVLENIPKVGKRVAETMHFIINHVGADPQQFHCIGHSYGSHVCGAASRRIPNFHRVTGLEPGGIVPLLQSLGKNTALKSTDAYYVDVIHTSVLFTALGLGIIQPVGDMDFYVNGGIIQNHCKFGRKYRVFKGDTVKVLTPLDVTICNHLIVVEYFINSVNDDCVFLGTKCGSVLSAVLNPILRLCPSNSSVTAKMGFHSKKIKGLPPKTAFYVETNEFPPYCKDKN